MARLEIDIALNNLQGATNGLKELQKNLNNLSGKGVKIDIGGSAINDVKAQSIEATTAIKQMVASANVNNATFLTKVKSEGIEAKTAILDLVKAGKELDNQNKANRNSLTEVTLATKQYALEQKKLKDESKNSKPELNEYQKLSRELTEMRNNMKNVGAQMIQLEKQGKITSSTYNDLWMQFVKGQKSILALDGSLKKLDSDLGQHQRKVGQYENALNKQAVAQSGANGVAMEFNRIIQDAPFGMMGIGNNIQQLAANYQVYSENIKKANDAQGKFTSTGSLMKGVLSSIISPANLLTLAIAAATSAWIWYEQKQQKANKEAQKATDIFQGLTDKFSRYEKSLSSYRSSSQSEISILKTLYEQATKETNARESRIRAVERMQKMYPSVLSNFSKEAIMAGKAKDAYLELARSIELNAKARAFEGSLSDAYKQQNDAIQAAKRLYKEYSLYMSKVNDVKGEGAFRSFIEASKDASWFTKFTSSVTGIDLSNYSDIADAIQAIQQNAKTAKSDIKNFKSELSKVYLDESYTDLKPKKPDALKDKKDDLKQQVDYLQQIKDLQGDKEKDLDLINVEGYARDLKELEWKYKEYFSNLTKIEKKYKDDEAKNKQSGVNESLEEARKTGIDLQKKEKLEIEKAWLEKRNELTKSANDKWGFISETSREKDFANLKNYIDNYRKELLKANATAEEVAEKIASIKSTATFKINVEYYKPMLDDLDKENDRIAESINKPFTSSNTMKMRKELKERLRVLRENLTAQQAAYDKISTKKGGTAGVEKIMKETKEKWEIEINAEFSKQTFSNLVSSFDGAFSSFFSNLDNNVELFGSKIGGIFKSLAHSLLETIGGIMDSLNQKNNENVMNKLLDGGLGSFKKNWSEMMGSFEGKVSAMAAAGDLLGNAIGSLTKKTSELGQGVAGGLKGAASGAQIGTMILPGLGTAIGAGIGGIIGGIKGIFGAKKAKKQEELQRQQLLEQQKANALLERMNALAYTSSIIGGQSQYGIVGGVNRSFDGQFEFVIDGQKMRSVLTNVDRFNGR